ncbi:MULTISPECIES: glycosyltransferase family 4 protein [Streptomyces]|uniref:glycosyltransferase family 4 protein n=1 Tax=Streptomyces TaxID=1883 RepID=UPI002249883E|nr:glycosyltransferase family 4 protein [Streptomyces sp. JHD 1]MCX2969609.1 glycosyltransferase family 4 protein [Streptomyces sp. JHD 1]
MKIAFLLYNAYGIGGTIRSTANLSAALAEAGHTVEIASVYRSRTEPRIDFGRGVRITPLIDWRKDAPGYEGGHPRLAEPTDMWPDPGVSNGPLAPTRLTDERVSAYLRETDAHVVIGTRPVLNGYLDRYGRRDYLRIGQEHVTLDLHTDQLAADQNAALAGLDAFVTVSEADARHYRRTLPDVATRILCVPNAVPAPEVSPSDLASKTVVAAGRLIPVKRYDRLIRAFAKVAAERPDWHLRLYGRGRNADALRRLVQELGLYNRVRLMGAVTPIETEWAKGAIAAVSSDTESFGMTIVEAMHCGVPVVATDCPYGPGEIITHGRDGLLVPLEGGEDAFADALLQLIDDEERRRAMGRAALETVRRYAPAAIAGRYLELIAELAAERGIRLPAAGAPAPRPRTLGDRLRSAVRALRPGRRSAPAPARPAARWTPTAHARATADGGLVVRVATAGMPHREHDLVLRLRKDEEGRSVRVPLPARDQAVDGRVEAVVERSAHTLAEGRWDAYVVPRGGQGRGRRVAATLVETAALVPLPPRSGADGVTSWVPYTTADGNLSVRTWLRPRHAEVEQVEVGEAAATVTARLYGVEAGPEAAVVAVSRQAEAYDFQAPVQALPDGRVSVTLPYDDVLARRSVEHDLWDLRLVPAPGAARVPLGRIGGDSADRRKTDTFPELEFAHADRGATRVKPYVTFRGELALSAKDRADEADGAAEAPGA